MRRLGASSSPSDVPHARAPARDFVFFSVRVLFVVCLSILGLLVPGLLVVAGIAGGSVPAVLLGALTLSLAFGLGWMVFSGQKKLRTMLRAIAEGSGLTLSESPDLVPGLAHLTLTGEVGGRWVVTAFENLPVAGTTEYLAGGGRWHISRTRRHLVARVQIPTKLSGDVSEWINLNPTDPHLGTGRKLSQENLAWLRERGCRKVRLGGGILAMALDPWMTEEGLEEAVRGISLLVEFADRLESGGKSGETSPATCPLCRGPIIFNPRYPRAVCNQCADRASDAVGRTLDFFNVDVGGGFRAVYREGGGSYDSHNCFIDAHPCRADEARFGGIVVQLSESNQSADIASRQKG